MDTPRPVQTILFGGASVRIGSFHCPPAHPTFENTGPIGVWPLVVFPRTSVTITHAGRQPVVADPNVVMFYNPRQDYRRGRLSERGDLCEFFAFDPAILLDALRPFDPEARERPTRPFTLTHGPSDSHSYLEQRLLVEQVTRAGGPPDELYVEEIALGLLGAVIRTAHRAHGLHPVPGRDRGSAALAHELRVLLATRFHEPLSLAGMAAALSTSPYHLCRVVRRHTGQTIHHYRNQIRLRTGLERVAQGEDNFLSLALDLGYDSHSHFTAAFRRAFGVVPSALRRATTRQLHSELSKNLIA
ncbi:MAG TPA: helix-turn-helix transcriptional regulator [Ardenticatenaceae bacterium]|nr:helix-turn-helix transcriptional regulator [Ardenticatenaceae bacterium]